MKKVPKFLLVAWILSSVAMAQEDNHGKFGVGGQVTFPTIGMSFIVNTESPFSIQAILGVFGDLKTYSGRLLFRIPATESAVPYAYGLFGAWSFRDYTDGLKKKTEIVPAYGFGLGLEYFKSEGPNIGYSTEIGYGSIKFRKLDYDIDAIMYGAGIHFYFD